MAARKTNKTNAETVSVEQTEQKFSKSQLVKCGKYRNRRDLVDALLDDNKKYTMKQVDTMIENFMKGKVK